MSDLDTLSAAFGQITAKAARQLRTVVRVTGNEALGVMRSEEPVDTGALRASTRARYSAGGTSVDVGPTVNYAGYVAYGTRRRRPNPFDQRTLERVGPSFVARCEAVAGDLL